MNAEVLGDERCRLSIPPLKKTLTATYINSYKIFSCKRILSGGTRKIKASCTYILISSVG